MRTSIITVFIMAALLSGCTDRLIVYGADSTGRLGKLGTFTPDEWLKQDIERAINSELSGQRPSAPAKTWGQYWRKYYQNQYPPKGAVEFSTHEKILAYVKQRRIARGLPTYD
jgi:hypothetical protein